jgi:hypothetical protein
MSHTSWMTWNRRCLASLGIILGMLAAPQVVFGQG